MRTTIYLLLLLINFPRLLAQGTAASEPAAVATSTDNRPTSWRRLLDSDSATLGQVRDVFLCKRVIVAGSLENLNGRNQLLEWRIAANPSPLAAIACSGGPAIRKALGQVPHITGDELNGLPASYSGKAAKVIAVQLHKSEGSGSRTNALGDAISDDDHQSVC